MKNAKEMTPQNIIINKLLKIKSDNYDNDHENVRKIMNGVINSEKDKEVYLYHIEHSTYPGNTKFALSNIINNKYGQFYDNKSSTVVTFSRR